MVRHSKGLFFDQQWPPFDGLISIKYSFLIIEIFILYIISQINSASPGCNNSALQPWRSWRTSLTSRILQSLRSPFIFHARIWSSLGLHRFLSILWQPLSVHRLLALLCPEGDFLYLCTTSDSYMLFPLLCSNPWVFGEEYIWSFKDWAFCSLPLSLPWPVESLWVNYHLLKIDESLMKVKRCINLCV